MSSNQSVHSIPRIDHWRCTGCGICAERCPTAAVEVHEGHAVIVRPNDCSFCDICESYCPEGAIGRPFQIRFMQPTKNQ